MSLRHRRLARLEAYSGSASEDYFPNPFRRYKLKPQGTASNAKILSRHGSRHNSRPPSPDASATDLTLTSPTHQTGAPVSPGERSHRFIIVPQQVVAARSSKSSSDTLPVKSSTIGTGTESARIELNEASTKNVWQRWTARVHALPFYSQDLTTDSRKADRALERANLAWANFMKVEPAVFVSDFTFPGSSIARPEPTLLNTSTIAFKSIATAYVTKTSSLKLAEVPDPSKSRIIPEDRRGLQVSIQGMRVIYVLDHEPTSDEIISLYFTPPQKDASWSRFKRWTQKYEAGRGAARKFAEWTPLRIQRSLDFQFAFGFEHCERFVAHIEESHDQAHRHIEVLAEAVRLGVFEKTNFAKIHQNARRALYFQQSSKDGKPYQRTIILTQSRPCHLKNEDKLHGTWKDKAYWDEYLKARETGEQKSVEQPFELQCFELLRTAISGIIFETIETWTTQVAELESVLEELETKVYDNPSDDSLSDLLWTLSRHLLEIQQTLGLHAGQAESLQSIANRYALEHTAWVTAKDENIWRRLSEEPWLEDKIKELQRLAENVKNDLVQPVKDMIDLMYKSVSIRDSRLSLELNSSLWRLSWITFIFLPLTFLAGFFGMNVDTFKRSPPLKWYFIVAAPMMLLILGCWLVFRYLVPHQQGAGYHENISRESSKLKSSKLGRMDTMQHL